MPEKARMTFRQVATTMLQFYIGQGLSGVQTGSGPGWSGPVSEFALEPIKSFIIKRKNESIDSSPFPENQLSSAALALSIVD